MELLATRAALLNQVQLYLLPMKVALNDVVNDSLKLVRILHCATIPLTRLKLVVDLISKTYIKRLQTEREANQSGVPMGGEGLH